MPPKKKAGKSGGDGDESLTRIAIVNAEKCKPKKCRQECKKSCPVVKLGKLCIEVTPKSKLAFISEPLCIGKSPSDSFEVQFRFCSRALFFANIIGLIRYRLWYLRQEVSI